MTRCRAAEPLPVSNRRTARLTQDRFEPTLEEVAHQPMAAIGRLGVDTVELTHPLGKVCIRRLNDEVIMLCEASHK